MFSFTFISTSQSHVQAWLRFGKSYFFVIIVMMIWISWYLQAAYWVMWRFLPLSLLTLRYSTIQDRLAVGILCGADWSQILVFNWNGCVNPHSRREYLIHTLSNFLSASHTPDGLPFVGWWLPPHERFQSIQNPSAWEWRRFCYCPPPPVWKPVVSPIVENHVVTTQARRYWWCHVLDRLHPANSRCWQNHHWLENRCMTTPHKSSLGIAAIVSAPCQCDCDERRCSRKKPHPMVFSSDQANWAIDWGEPNWFVSAQTTHEHGGCEASAGQYRHWCGTGVSNWVP